MSTNIEAIRDQVEAAIFEIEHRRAQGRLADGNWHALRAVESAESATGWEIYECEDVSPSCSPAEYYGEPGAPVVIWECRESDSPGALDSGCVWEESQWDSAEYARPADDWENYICLGAGLENAFLEAQDKGLIDPSSPLPEGREQALSALKAAGFIPFDLGDWSDPVDLDYQIDKAMEQISNATNQEIS